MKCPPPVASETSAWVERRVFWCPLKGGPLDREPYDYPSSAVERAMKAQEVILRAMDGRLKWYQAAEIIGISDRRPADAAMAGSVSEPVRQGYGAVTASSEPFWSRSTRSSRSGKRRCTRLEPWSHMHLQGEDEAAGINDCECSGCSAIEQSAGRETERRGVSSVHRGSIPAS